MKVKGYLQPKKKITLADAIKTKIANEVSGEIETLDKKLDTSLEEKAKEIDKKIEEVDLKLENHEIILDKKIEEVDNVIQETKDTLTGAVEKIVDYVKEIAKPGEPGKDAEEIDQEKLINEILARIPKVDQDAIMKAILDQIPAPEKVDEEKLLSRFLKKIPAKKGSLKIIQEKVETDPMSVIEEIMKLPDERFKLKTKNIDGLEQTIRAIQNQLARGYLHGGGLSTVAVDGTTIIGDGTTSNPLVANLSVLTVYGKNTSGSLIAKGTPVSIVAATGSFTALGTVDITTPASYAYIGLALTDIAKNGFGYVLKNGVLSDVNTSLLTEGRPIYVSASGGLTTTYPTVPNYIINVGICEYQHAIHGRINVIPLIQPKLQDLSDVDGTPLTTSGQMMVWNNTGKYFDANYNINNYLPTTGIEPLEVNITWKVGYNGYKEFTKVGGKVTKIDVWTDATKTTKLFTKTFTRTGSQLTTITNKDEIANKTLTKTFAYSGSSISNITSTIS